MEFYTREEKYDLKTVLKELKHQFHNIRKTAKNNKRETVFICYAWVTEQEREKWGDCDLREFLLRLYTDLSYAGFNPHLDLKSNEPTKSVNRMMEKIKVSDHVLCFLTPAFKEKFGNPDSTLYTENGLIQQRKDLKDQLGEDRGVYYYRTDERKKCVPEQWCSKGENELARKLPGLSKPKPPKLPLQTLESTIDQPLPTDDYISALKMILENLLLAHCGGKGIDKYQRKLFDLIWGKLDIAQASQALYLEPSKKQAERQLLPKFHDEIDTMSEDEVNRYLFWPGVPPLTSGVSKIKAKNVHSRKNIVLRSNATNAESTYSSITLGDVTSNEGSVTLISCSNQNSNN